MEPPAANAPKGSSPTPTARLLPSLTPQRAAGAGLLGSLAFAIAWTWSGSSAPYLFGLGLASFAFIALLARGMPRLLLGLGTGSLLAFVTVETSDFAWSLTVPQLLTLEAVLAILPLAAFLVLLRGVGLASRRSTPISTRVITLVLVAVGTVVRWGEISILHHPSTTLPSVQYALREDLACVLWGFGAMAAAAGFVFQMYRQSLRNHPERRRAPLLVTGAAVLVVAGFVGINLGAVAEAKMDSGSLLAIGVHTNDVSAIDPKVTPVAHLEIAWEVVERHEGEFQWHHYDWQIDHARENGISLYLLVNTYPPRWVVEKYPDGIMVDQWGAPFTWPDEAPGTARTKVWDMSFHHPGVMAAKTRFIREALNRYGDDPSVRFVSVQNEPSYPHDFNLFRFASYDPFTEAAFVRELREDVHDDLRLLNTLHGTDFESWNEVEPPAAPGLPLWERWQSFREDSLIAFVHTLADAARASTDKPITAKVMGHFLARFSAPQAALSERALRGIIDAIDVVSLDLYPASTADLERSLQYFQHLAGGKPLVVAEFNLLLGTHLPTAGATLLRSLNTLEKYTDTVILFTRESHYLYQVNLSEGTLVRRVLDLYRAPGWDPELPLSTAHLAWVDALSLTNVYPAYVLVSEVLAVPVVPWPFLAIAMVPVMPTGRLPPRIVLAIRLTATGLLIALGYLALQG